MIKQFTSEAIDHLAIESIKDKGDKFQEDLLKATKDGAVAFQSFVLSVMQDSGEKIIDGEQEMNLPEEGFTANEFNDLPISTMEEMFSIWSDIEKRDACEPGVWAYINLKMVENKLIDPVFFAGKDGARRIDEALNLKSLEERKTAIDGCVRHIVRCFAGCPRIRGIRTLYQDCAPARAWRVCRLADDATYKLAQNEQVWKETHAAVLSVLHESSVWNNLSERIVSKLTVLGDEKIRNGIVLFLTEEKKDNKKGRSRFLKGGDLKRLFRCIGQMCAWRALGYFESHEISDIIKDEIVPLVPPNSPNSPKTTSPSAS